MSYDMSSKATQDHPSYVLGCVCLDSVGFDVPRGRELHKHDHRPTLNAEPDKKSHQHADL